VGPHRASFNSCANRLIWLHFQSAPSNGGMNLTAADHSPCRPWLLPAVSLLVMPVTLPVRRPQVMPGALYGANSNGPSHAASRIAPSWGTPSTTDRCHVMTKPKPQPFTSGQLETLCKALAHTETGLTGTEIGQILHQIRVADVSPDLTKWKRLFNALVTRQNKEKTGDRVLAFIAAALDPVRYAGNADRLEQRRSGVNVALVFYGLEFCEDGKFRAATRATTLPEAERRANRLRSVLHARGVHADVLAYCRAELLQQNYFHAVLEATKSVAGKIRARTGLSSDGATLVNEALGGTAPVLRINTFATESERGEQRGFVNLLNGLFGTFRNPTAHAAKVEWPINETDALDLLTLCSYMHRRLDAATK
jgi:uncharacterized protein (TIGR02391 family)